MSGVVEQQSAGTAGERRQPAPLRLWDQRAVFRPFAAAGCASIVAGGLLASAIAAPAPTRHGVWSVAYLVLVLGVGQLMLGAGLALLATAPPGRRTVGAIALAFNIAGVAIVLGIVTDHVVVFDAGSALLLGALVVLLSGVRRSTYRGWTLHVYRGLIALLIVSIPIGAYLTTIGTT